MQSASLAENHFLVVDGSAFSRDTLSRTLQDQGADKVDTAINADTAIKLCKKQRYDVVLADYDLGEGKNGQQLLECLHHERLLKTSSAFIMLTAETTRDVVLSTLEFQPDDYIAKPYLQSLLTRRLKRILRYKYQLRRSFQALESRNYSQAIKDCETYLQGSDEFQLSCQQLLADLYLADGRYDDALTIYDDELLARDSDWARLGLAKVYLQQQLLDEAEGLFLELIDANYMYVEAYEQLAAIYLERELWQQAEDIMARAVLVSPLSLKRQQHYARVCERNHHFDRAATAWRETLKLARNSSNDTEENFLGLACSLVDFCEFQHDFSDTSITAEAADSLAVMRKNYHVFGDSQLQGLLLEGRIALGCGRTGDGDELLQQAIALYEANPSSYSAQSRLELAKSLAMAGKSSVAEKVLSELVANTDDREVIAKADQILDEPVSKLGKSRIIDLNREGINCFKQQAYDGAAKAFREAWNHFPKNLELNLNLVQALIKLIVGGSDEQQKERWLEEAELCLHQLSGISRTHKKYDSYQRLAQEIDQLQRA